MMLTEEDIIVYIDIEPRINLRPGNVKDCLTSMLLQYKYYAKIVSYQGGKNQAQCSLGKMFHK